MFNKYNVDNWEWYKPSISQYTRYFPYELAAGLKIEDVYMQIKNARSSLLFTQYDSYKPFVTEDNDITSTYLKSKFLFDALANYNYCIDLSWQFLYIYYGNNDYSIIQDNKVYERETKECNKESLRYRMVGLAKEREKFDYVMHFLNIPLTKEVRNAYNYIKHRGTYHIKGLGIQGDDRFPTVFSGAVPTLKIITREIIDLDEWGSKLTNFDISFYQYFEKLVQELMPCDFTDGTVIIKNLPLISERLEQWYKGSNRNKNVES
ncbi:hypothetical protein [Priestia endophytica]|uniref:hypothetical protein n=1 Tax=Priestia endophytica TaxID=135735 RepID=UPI000F5408EE|nr:hypothetical protein [Priestia endophytica]